MTSRRVMLAMAVLGLCAGCASLASRVPPVTPRMETMATARGANGQTLRRGREVYLRDCTRCHGPVPVASRSAAQWAEILPRMEGKARLAPGAAADLAGYVRAVVADSTTP